MTDEERVAKFAEMYLGRDLGTINKASMSCEELQNMAQQIADLMGCECSLVRNKNGQLVLRISESDLRSYLERDR